MFSQPILIAVVMGMERRAPTTPQSHPQKRRDTSTTTGLRFSRSPITLGAIPFPITSWIVRTENRVITAGRSSG